MSDRVVVFGNEYRKVPKIFISSTYVDLKEHRKLVTNALERIGMQVIGMEIFGAMPKDPVHVCYEEISRSDIFVGIYAHRYGSIPKGHGKSIIELELEYALKLNKPVLVFIMDKNYPWPPRYIDTGDSYIKLQSFKKKLKEHFVVEKFTSPEDLAYKVVSAVIKCLAISDWEFWDFRGIIKNNYNNNPYIPFLKKSRTLEELLKNTMLEICRITKTDYNQILLISTFSYHLRLVVLADSIPPHKQRYRIATLNGIIGKAFTTGSIVNVGNVHQVPNYFQAVVETNSELVVPIIANNVTIGVINSESENYNHYTKNMERRLIELSSALGRLLQEYGWSPDFKLDKLPWIKLTPQKCTS